MGQLRLLGGLLYRSKRYDQAVAGLKLALERRKDDGSPASMYFLLALAQGRLGKTEEAKASLAQGVQAAEKSPPETWHRRLEWQLLRSEAETLLATKWKETPSRAEEREHSRR